MQAPRNWRNNVDRYRLTVKKDENGNTSVVNRPQSLANNADRNQTRESDKVTVPAA